jgi:hypothetical protein
MRYMYENEGREFEVQYDSYPPDTSLRINGIQAEPDYGGYVEINSVTLLGIEMIDLLSEAVYDDIRDEIMGVKT